MINYDMRARAWEHKSTKAAVKRWVDTTHDSLIAAGLIQTDDTGQLNIAEDDEAAVSGSATTHGYRIYEINDAYSGVQPIYIKIGFRTSNSTSGGTHSGILTVQVGFGTDGSGALVGVVTDERSLSSYITNSSATYITSAMGARTFTTHGEDFVVHGNELSGAYQSTSNVAQGGLFSVIRSKVNGVVDPESFVFVFCPATNLPANAGALLYYRVSKSLGTSSLRTHMMKVPLIADSEGLIVATCADISEQGNIEYTDKIIATRHMGTTLHYTIMRLSVDGITEKEYLMLPTALSTSNSAPNADSIPLNLKVDMVEQAVGMIGVLVGE